MHRHLDSHPRHTILEVFQNFMVSFSCCVTGRRTADCLPVFLDIRGSPTNTLSGERDFSRSCTDFAPFHKSVDVHSIAARTSD